MSIFFPRNEAARQRAAAQQERMRAREERRAYRALSREMRRASSVASEGYAKAGMVGALQELYEHERRVLAILQELYNRTIGFMFREVMKNAPKARIRRIERKDPQGEAERLVLEWIHSKGLEKAVAIGRTTRNQIIQAIEDGISEGIGEQATAKLILQRTKRVSATRARVIARTETHAASQSTSLEIAKQLDLGSDVKKEWVSVEDDRTRESHRDVDGQKVGMNDRFKVGEGSLSFPGDPSGPAEEVINCRCVMVYV